MTSKRSFALSYPQKPAMSRAVLEQRISRNPLLSLPELIHLTTFSKSTREKGGNQTALFPLKKKNEFPCCYTRINVKKEQRKINPYQILIFSERQGNHPKIEKGI